MIKRIFFLMALLVMGAIVVYMWFQWSMSSVAGEKLVPSGTVFYAAIPDTRLSALRFPNTALGKMCADKSISDFAAKPLSTLISPEAWDSFVKTIEKLKPSRIFVAVPSLEASTLQVLVGFQYLGGVEAYTESVGTSGILSENYNGVEIQASGIEFGGYLFCATIGNWGFVANNRAVLIDALDRASGRNQSPSLASDPEFIEAKAQLTRSDFIAFARTEPILNTLLALGDVMGAVAIPEHIEFLREVRTIAYAIKLGSPEISDTLVATTTKQDTESLPSLEHSGMDFTTNRSLGYFDFALPPTLLTQALTLLTTQAGIDVKGDYMPALAAQLPDTLKGEISLLMSWPGDTLIPRLVATARLTNPEAATNIIESLVKPHVKTEASQQGTWQVYHFPQESMPLLDPSAAIDSDLLIMSLARDTLMLTLQPPLRSPTLHDCEVFSPALDAYQNANQAFVFLDTRSIVERGFPLLRQILSLGLIPNANNFIETSKIPTTECLAGNALPWVYSQSRTENGILINSSGTIPATHAALLFYFLATTLFE